jgi:hypothetical protein
MLGLYVSDHPLLGIGHVIAKDTDISVAEPVTDGDGEGLVVGIAAAATYLGYDKPDSFRRARTRHPIPGEIRSSDGRPSWSPAALRTWRAKPGDPAAARAGVREP